MAEDLHTLSVPSSIFDVFPRAVRAFDSTREAVESLQAMTVDSPDYWGQFEICALRRAAFKDYDRIIGKILERHGLIPDTMGEV